MASILDFIPLFPDDTEDTIYARVADWANEGLDPDEDADQWTDTREGSHFWITVRPACRELARLYDLAGTEAVAAGMPLYAWADYLEAHGAVQTIERKAGTRAEGEVTFTGPEGTVIAAGTTVGVAPVAPDDDVPSFEVTVGGTIDVSGSITLAVRATEVGSFANVAANAITEPETPLPPLVELTNADPTLNGTDEESDEALRERVLGAYKGSGPGTRRDYERIGLAWAGVGRVTVIPLWNGPGTVKMIVSDADGNPLSGGTVAALQADVDPTPGRGDGQAPVSANVTVETAVGLPITWAADVEFEPGYSLDGDGGTIARRDAITTALRSYTERVEPGGEVVYEAGKGRIVTVEGVHDVSNVELNGGTVNVAVDDDPAEQPQLDSVDLTEV